MALVLASCARQAAPPTSPLAPVSPLLPLQLPPESKAVITYERHGGLAGVQNVWRIYSDGRVEFSSKNKPTIETQLPAGVVDNALQQIADSGFFALAGEYMPDNRCCDLFTHTLTVTRGQTTKTVLPLDGAEQPQAWLDAMAVVASLIQ